LTPDDAWGPTPADLDWCRERIASLRSDGIFTPPSLEGTVVFPGFIGGMHWGGLSHDPVRHLLIVNTNRIAHVVRLMPRVQWWLAALASAFRDTKGEFAPQFGTPYGMYRETLRSPSGALCNAPPWGTLAAVDLARGEVRWEIPLGISDPRGSGSTNVGGAVTTAGGLVFIAAARDPTLRAFDVETGHELWSTELPASAQATPMTYQLGQDRRQFVAIAAGGHGKQRTKMGDHVVAFTLP
jgi:quinoprotein glucose dehydrogenase